MKDKVLASIAQIIVTVIAILGPLLAWKSSIDQRFEASAMREQKNSIRLDTLMEDRMHDGADLMSELKQLRSEVGQMKVDLSQRLSRVETKLEK